MCGRETREYEPATTHASPAVASITAAANSSSGAPTQFGRQYSASSSTNGASMLRASGCANVLFPLFDGPMTTTRCGRSSLVTPSRGVIVGFRRCALRRATEDSVS